MSTAAIAMPVEPEQLDAAFLTHVVRQAHPDITVQRAEIVSARTHGDGDADSPVSTSAQVRLTMTYDGPGSDALPRQVLAKMSFADAGIWNGILDDMFANEVNFYNHVRAHVDMEAPRGVGGLFDPESRRFVLLMDDLTPKQPRFNTIMQDDDLALVRRVVDLLARLHAAFWDSPRLRGDLAWVEDQVDGKLERLLRGLTRDLIQSELHKEKWKAEFVQQLGTSKAQMEDGLRALKVHQARTLPQTLLHGDPHYANSYVLPDGTPGLFDWQIFARGFGIHDINYHVVNALSVEARRTHERDLIAFYRDRLMAHGVKEPPSFDTLWREYRMATHYCVYGGWLTVSREGYGWEICVLAILRAVAAYQDHETARAIADIS